MESFICIIGALKEEISGVKGLMEVHETIPAGMGRAYCGVWSNRRIVLVRSGVGRDLAEKALKDISGRYTLSQIVSIGFAGGLDPDLKTGDLVFANSVKENFEGNGKDAEGNLLFTDSQFLDRALNLSVTKELNVRRGCLVTVDHPACTFQEKRFLFKRFSAIAVDMETSVLLRWALSNEIPLISVRVISDSANQELVDFSHCINENGQLSKLKAGWHVVIHPGLFSKVETIRQSAQLAAKNLTRYLEEWIASTW